MPSILFLTSVERALKVATQCKARQYTDCSSERYGNQKPDKAEQITEREQCENQPDRVQPDTLSHEFRRQDISFNTLVDQKYPEDHQDRSVVWPELRYRNGQRQNQTGHRADVGNESDQPGNQSDQQAEIKTRQRQRDGIERAEDQAHGSLTVQKAGNRRVDLARQAPHSVALVQRDPPINSTNHAVPVVDQIKCNYRRNDIETGTKQPLDPRSARITQ